MPLTLTHHPQGVLLNLKVVPGARRDRIVGVLGDALKVAVSKPPEAGAANAAVIDLLTRALGIPASDLELTRGHTSARKTLLVRKLTPADLQIRLDRVLVP